MTLSGQSSVAFDVNSGSKEPMQATNIPFFDSSYSKDQFPPPSNLSSSSYRHSGSFQGGLFEDEPPLLEELGINFEHIRSKSLSVLNPFKSIDTHITRDTDLAGPLFFALLFGIFLLLTGKVHFGYIYGMGALGCVSMYLILNLMSESGANIYIVVSVLGYCLLPMVLLAFLSLLIPLTGITGFILAALCIAWCTHSAALMFVHVLSLVDQRLLVAYPIGLLYTCFGLLTVF